MTDIPVEAATTAGHIAEARQHFETRIHEPDPQAANLSARRSGYIDAFKLGTGDNAGTLSFGVSLDPLVVRTTQFETEPAFRGRHVALLLAYELRAHYGIEMLHSTNMEPTTLGDPLLNSLRRRGIMYPQPPTEGD